jgi:hypothetical protein
MSQEFFVLKVDENSFNANLESLTDYGDRPNLCLMLEIGSTLIFET